MFGLHNIGDAIQTTAGKLTITGTPMMGGEGAGYKATLNGTPVFYKEFNNKAVGHFNPDQTASHRRRRTEWLVNARLDQLDSRINSPFAMTKDRKTMPGYVCQWIDDMTSLEEWRQLPLSYADRTNATGQLAGLLALLHDRGIAQGDLNAANVGILGSGDSLTVVLFDFGNFNAGINGLEPLMSGEAEHMAFWLRSGHTVPDIQSDVYAFGVMAHELLLARPLTAGCKDVQEMMSRLEQGRLPGDPMLGADKGAEVGLPYQILSPNLQTMLRNMVAPNPAFVPSIQEFLIRFQHELGNLVSCSCGTPYWWHAQRSACPSCHTATPAAVIVRLPDGKLLPIRRNQMLGRDTLGGAPYLSQQHLVLQPTALGQAIATIRGRNGMQLIRYDGSRLDLPPDSAPVSIRPGDRLTLQSTSLEILAG